METTRLYGFILGFYWNYTGYISPIKMQNQIEKKMEHEMETCIVG